MNPNIDYDRLVGLLQTAVHRAQYDIVNLRVDEEIALALLDAMRYHRNAMNATDYGESGEHPEAVIDECQCKGCRADRNAQRVVEGHFDIDDSPVPSPVGRDIANLQSRLDVAFKEIRALREMIHTHRHELRDHKDAIVKQAQNIDGLCRNVEAQDICIDEMAKAIDRINHPLMYTEAPRDLGPGGDGHRPY